MKRKIQCAYCGKEFWTPIKKMWVIWLCNVAELKTKNESGEDVVIHNKTKLKTCGANESHEEAEKFVIPDMRKDQCKEIERVDTIRENFCGKCKHSAKVYHDRVMARMKKEARARAIASGDKSGMMAGIPDKDYRGYLRFLVDSRVESDYKREEEHAKKVKEAEAKNEAKILETKKPSMGKEHKVNKPE